MPSPGLPIAVRLHRYGFLVTADVNLAGHSLAGLESILPANDGGHEARTSTSRERELFLQLTRRLRHGQDHPHTNLLFLRRSTPVSPASFAAALWGMPFTARAVLVLVCVEGFSLAEAAFITELPLNRATHLMRLGLKEMGAESE